MLPPPQDTRPIADLPAELNRVASDLNAICVVAADESGGVIDASSATGASDLQTLAALGTANLVSSIQLLSLAQAASPETGPLITLVEGENMRLIVAGKPGGMIFISLLGAHSPLGLARLEMRALAELNWELPTHSFNEDQALIDQELAAHGLSDDLFLFGGDEEA